MTWWRDRESAVRIYEEIAGVLRSLGIRFADRLSIADLRIADEYIDANELGLALEHLADQLCEYHLPVSPDERVDMLALAERMEIKERVAGCLELCPMR